MCSHHSSDWRFGQATRDAYNADCLRLFYFQTAKIAYYVSRQLMYYVSWHKVKISFDPAGLPYRFVCSFPYTQYQSQLKVMIPITLCQLWVFFNCWNVTKTTNISMSVPVNCFCIDDMWPASVGRCGGNGSFKSGFVALEINFLFQLTNQLLAKHNIASSMA